MVFAEDIRKTILKLADEKGPEQTFAADDVAQSVDHENWEMLIEQVRFVASVLIKEGKIIATSSGKVVDVTKTNGPLLFKKRIR
jgi:hypothetical protein